MRISDMDFVFSGEVNCVFHFAKVGAVANLPIPQEQPELVLQILNAPRYRLLTVENGDNRYAFVLGVDSNGKTTSCVVLKYEKRDIGNCIIDVAEADLEAVSFVKENFL